MSCFSCFGAVGRRKAMKKLVVLILGIDGAGKTTVLLRLKGDGGSAKRTSWGFTTATLAHEVPPPAPESSKKKSSPRAERVDATYYDVGGDSKIRGIWKNYYAEACACIYVVDAADRERIPEAADALAEIYAHERMKDKPLLVLANKQDLPQALNADELHDALKISDIRARQTTTTNERDDNGDLLNWWVRILPCRTNVGDDSHTIAQDFLKATEITTLLRAVLDRFHVIAPRCVADAEQQKRAWDVDREEQKKRVEEYRAEEKENASGSAATAPADVSEGKVIASQEMEEAGGGREATTAAAKKSAGSLFGRRASANTVHPEPLPVQQATPAASENNLHALAEAERASEAKKTNTVHPEGTAVSSSANPAVDVSATKNVLHVDEPGDTTLAVKTETPVAADSAAATVSSQPKEPATNDTAAIISQSQSSSDNPASLSASADNGTHKSSPKLDDGDPPSKQPATPTDPASSPTPADPLPAVRPLPSRLDSNTSTLSGKIAKRGILAPLDSSELHHPVDHHPLPPLASSLLPPTALHQAPWVKGPLGSPAVLP
ncbi:ADP-ribosylation factor-like protein 13B [Geranomyces michiganensis]|nr:ADP-ribosylation factor-like protein 13B [Geranomyces michiganensis]